MTDKLCQLGPSVDLRRLPGSLSTGDLRRRGRACYSAIYPCGAVWGPRPHWLAETAESHSKTGIKKGPRFLLGMWEEGEQGGDDAMERKLPGSFESKSG
jgi:hypothetical protein